MRHQKVSQRNLTARAIQSTKAAVGALEMTVRGEALRHLAHGKQSTLELLSTIRIGAMQEVRSSADLSRDALQTVKTEAVSQLAAAKRDVPIFLSQICVGSTHALKTASAGGDAIMGNVLERASRATSIAKQGANAAFEAVSSLARQHVRDGESRAEALMREIAGQGPEKTLRRGFAIVRNEAGLPVTRASQAVEDAAIEIQFHDGRVTATTGQQVLGKI